MNNHYRDQSPLEAQSGYVVAVPLAAIIGLEPGLSVRLAGEFREFGAIQFLRPINLVPRASAPVGRCNPSGTCADATHIARLVTSEIHHADARGVGGLMPRETAA